MGIFKVFISYSSHDKQLGGLFKQSFEKYAGFSVFLAHDDISPALEWEVKIIKNLKSTDIVIPLITDNYRGSEFTDQELGMSLALNKIIIPIKLSNINPYGFISKLQALKCRHNQNDIINAVATIVFVLVSNNEFNTYKDLVIDSVIGAFCNSDSYKTTRTIIRTLTKINTYNTYQIDSLKKAIKTNSQIYDEVYALPTFLQLLKNRYQIDIDS